MGRILLASLILLSSVSFANETLWRGSRWEQVDAQGRRTGRFLTVTPQGVPSLTTPRRSFTFKTMPSFTRSRLQDPDFDGEKWTAVESANEKYGASFEVSTGAKQRGYINCYNHFQVEFDIDHVIQDVDSSTIEVTVSWSSQVVANLYGSCFFSEHKTEKYQYVRVQTP